MSRNLGEAQPDRDAVAVVPSALTTLLGEAPAVTAGPRGLVVWQVLTDAISDEDLDLGRNWLDDGERDRAASFVRADLRRPYEIAHAAARLVVGAASATPPEKVVWGRHDCPGCGEPHGRPRAEGAGVEFSLSHTPGQVLIAVAGVAVGVDVERHPDDPVALARLLHPRETDEIVAAAHGTLDGGRAAVRFTRAWARTEAYLKGIGIGLGRDPHLDYLGSDAAAGRTLGPWTIRDIAVGDGFGAAVALSR